MKTAICQTSLGIAIGVLASLLSGNVVSVKAQIATSWSKDKVLPVIFVKPGIGAFVPETGNTIGISWTKDEVIPIMLVKPYLMGTYVPLDGSPIGAEWTQEQVKPVIFVEPGLGGAFVASGSSTIASQPTMPATTEGACSPAIETQINGDFKGWDEDNTYKMMDGSIWQQATYHYHYHYAFDPDVLIYPGAAGICHIKIDGDDDEGVDVIRLK